ncbi:CPBP family intramembrane glutamic endopeptidase [Brevibacterium album]|uniref:CPBP family intramembrane glutamic endopeptidase n=1 Tax=Brevibacterium album TaxID=417948 RepID=UPI0003FCC421|nr:CPBP family intramembrane glutamic endopeptidase [Brevibacterium album]
MNSPHASSHPDPLAPPPGLRWSSSYRTPRARWWKGAIGIVLILASVFVLSTAFSMIAVTLDMVTGIQVLGPGGALRMTPLLLLATNLSLIAAGGIALLLHRFLCGLRVSWFHSLGPGLRMPWLLTSLAVAAPVYLLFAASSLLDPAYRDFALDPKALGFLAVVVLTTPLQAAAEEYMFRGVVQRAAGSWVRSGTASLVIGALVSAVLFSIAHFAADPWLIGYYFAFGVGLSLLAHLTGGLEAGIAVHLANNLFLLLLASVTGEMDAGFDRSAGVGGPILLVPIALLAVVVLVLARLARRRGLTTVTAGEQTPAGVGIGSPH